MAKSYRAVFFDLDGTLRIPTPNPTNAFIQFAQSLGIGISAQAAHRLKLWAHSYWGEDEGVKRDMEFLGVDAFWINYSRLLLEQVNATENLATHARWVREWFATGYDPHIELVTGGKHLLKQLLQQGYIVGLISNRSEPLHDEVITLGLDGLFDFTLAAGEVGYWKPNPSIFIHAVTHFAGLQPEACVYVGDNYFADGRGAAAAGLDSIIFDPEDLYGGMDCRRIRRMAELTAHLHLEQPLSETVASG